MGRGTVALGAALLMSVSLGCDDSTGLDARPRLERIEIVAGAGQSAVEGAFLAERVQAEAIVDDGSRYFGTVFVRIDSGNGGIELGASRGEGNGVELAGPVNFGSIFVDWKMGPSGEEQRLVFFALAAADDTVFASVTAESLPPS